jgi:signal transduction histidine kinase
MIKNLKNPYYHIGYWVFVILVLTRTFGVSWGNNSAAFFFVSMLLPIVLGTSYFFNYVLVPKFYLQKKFRKFVLYTLYTAIVSLYLEMIVLLLAFVFMVNMNFQNLAPNATQVSLLAAVLYLLVFVGSFLLMMGQIAEHQKMIIDLQRENEKMKKASLEIVSNRKKVKIPYNDILFIESLSDFIQINTETEKIVSKEKISHLAERLPTVFVRVHRSFIVNKEKIKGFSSEEVLFAEVSIPIGRSFKKAVKDTLHDL